MGLKEVIQVGTYFHIILHDILNIKVKYPIFKFENDVSMVSSS